MMLSRVARQAIGARADDFVVARGEDFGGVDQRFIDRIALAIGGGECVFEAIGRLFARAGVEQRRAHQLLAEIILPGARQARDLGIERARIGIGAGLVDVADHEQHARELAFAQLRREAFHLTAKGAGDRLADALAQFGIEAILRNIGERGDEAVEAVAAHEHARARAVEQVQNAARGVQQFFARDLPELFARIIFDDLAQRLGVVAARREAACSITQSALRRSIGMLRVGSVKVSLVKRPTKRISPIASP